MPIGFYICCFITITTAEEAPFTSRPWRPTLPVSPLQLYTSKELSTTGSSTLPTTKISTEPVHSITQASTTPYTITQASTKKKYRTSKRTTRFTTPSTSTLPSTFETPALVQNRFLNYQRQPIQTESEVKPQEVILTDENVYQYEEPVISTNNGAYSNYQQNPVYQMTPSANYRVNFQSGNQFHSFNVGDSGGTLSINSGGMPSQMIRDGNNYKLVVYT